MKSVLKIKNILDKIEGKISFNENLSKLSWFNIGGPAQVLFRPKNLRDLSLFLKTIDKEEKIKILGAGSNTLIREGGYEGIIIKLGSSFSRISLFNDKTFSNVTSIKEVHSRNAFGPKFMTNLGIVIDDNAVL